MSDSSLTIKNSVDVEINQVFGQNRTNSQSLRLTVIL